VNFNNRQTLSFSLFDFFIFRRRLNGPRFFSVRYVSRDLGNLRLLCRILHDIVFRYLPLLELELILFVRLFSRGSPLFLAFPLLFFSFLRLSFFFPIDLISGLSGFPLRLFTFLQRLLTFLDLFLDFPLGLFLLNLTIISLPPFLSDYLGP